MACVAENNIPVVGKEQVAAQPRDALDPRRPLLRRRHRHDESVQAFHQPVPCMQCENAPCEVVCPVAATTHSAEGLNDMVYNRCVGTRYCSNNCPYKVRRFNFLLYSGLEHAEPRAAAQSGRHGPQPRRHGEVHLLRAAHQPRAHRRQAGGPHDPRRRDRHRLPEACPADAIVFGDLNDPEQPGRTSCKAQERNYGLLEDLNTRPRTTYLAAMRNPNPELEPGAGRGPTTGH